MWTNCSVQTQCEASIDETCCRLLGVKGSSVETWNIISYSPTLVYSDHVPVESAAHTYTQQQYIHGGVQEEEHTCFM